MEPDDFHTPQVNTTGVRQAVWTAESVCPIGVWGVRRIGPLGHGFCSTIDSGRVAKEVMESSAKIKREPPEIHR